MGKYTIESCVFFNNNDEKELVKVLKQYGEIVGTSGGFPLSPMVYKWVGDENGLSEVKKFNRDGYGVEILGGGSYE